MSMGPAQLDDIGVRMIVAEELDRRGQQLTSLLGRHEDALMWAMKFYEGASGVTPDDVVVAAKAFHAYVYGEESSK